jgi:hypothetical protein
MVDRNQTNTNKETKDITPQRSEAISNRKGTSVGGASMLFTATLGFVNLTGLVLLTIWFFNTSDNQQSAGQNFVDRISKLEEISYSQNETLKKFTEETEEDLKFINKEIRKLWDLSNKKNRKDINSNLNNLSNLKTQADEMSMLIKGFGAKQRARDLEFSKLEKQLLDTQTALEGIAPSSESSDLESRLLIQEEAQKNMDAYRKQVTANLLKLQGQLDKLKIKLELSDSEKATSPN